MNPFICTHQQQQQHTRSVTDTHKSNSERLSSKQNIYNKTWQCKAILKHFKKFMCTAYSWAQCAMHNLKCWENRNGIVELVRARARISLCSASSHLDVSNGSICFFLLVCHFFFLARKLECTHRDRERQLFSFHGNNVVAIAIEFSLEGSVSVYVTKCKSWRAECVYTFVIQ